MRAPETTKAHHGPYTKPESIWSKCQDCDEFWCELHKAHVHDCDCPPIETWMQHDRDPYSDTPDFAALTWAWAHPLDRA